MNFYAATVIKGTDRRWNEIVVTKHNFIQNSQFIKIHCVYQCTEHYCWIAVCVANFERAKSLSNTKVIFYIFEIHG